MGLGSNVPHPRHGRPRSVLAAAVEALGSSDVQVIAVSRVITSAPLGPSRRRYANGAAVIATNLMPEALLRRLQAIEFAFGRKRRGARWTARVLDLDLVLWSGGAWSTPALTIPHPRMRDRQFVLAPAEAIAADWLDPLTGLTVRQLRARLTRANPLP